MGWKAIVAAPGSGTEVRSNVPASDPTNGLRTYPEDLLREPLGRARRPARRSPGAGTLTAPDGKRTAVDSQRSEDGLTGVFGDAAAGEGVLLLLLLAAFGWGAVHALSPGHGKAMVAAYLVGTRGRPRHAFALGAIVTVTHTAGVFALGADHARALPVRAARDALPLAEPDLRPARGRDRRVGAALAPAPASHTTTTTGTTTITTTTITTTGTATSRRNRAFAGCWPWAPRPG